jgi:hypothetical protein
MSGRNKNTGELFEFAILAGRVDDPAAIGIQFANDKVRRSPTHPTHPSGGSTSALRSSIDDSAHYTICTIVDIGCSTAVAQQRSLWVNDQSNLRIFNMPALQTFERLVFGIEAESASHDHAHIAFRTARAAIERDF